METYVLTHVDGELSHLFFSVCLYYFYRARRYSHGCHITSNVTNTYYQKTIDIRGWKAIIFNLIQRERQYRNGIKCLIEVIPEKVCF